MTLDGAWSAPEPLETLRQGMARPTRLAVAPGGRAIAAWALGRPEPGVWIARFEAATGWEKAVQVSSRPRALDWVTPQGTAAAIDGHGHAAVVWTDDDKIWASRGTLGGPWTPPEIISGETRAFGNTQAAILPDGSVVAVWVCWPDSSRRGDVRICANSHAPGSGWGRPRLTDPSHPYGNLQMAALPDGEAAVIWTQGPVLLRRFSPKEGWRAPEQLSPGGDALSPRIAADGAGRMLAIWAYPSKTWNTVHMRRFSPDEGWGSPLSIGLGTNGTVGFPEVSMNSRGEAVALWSQTGTERSLGPARVYANRLGAAGAAAGPELVDSGERAASGGQEKIVLDERGNALAVWLEGGSGELVFSRYVAGKGWSAPLFAGAHEKHATTDVTLASDGAGGALLVWSESNGARSDLWARRWQAAEPGRPVSSAVPPPRADLPPAPESGPGRFAVFLYPGLFKVEYPFSWNEQENYRFGDYEVLVKFEEPLGRAQFQIMRLAQEPPPESLDRIAAGYAARMAADGTALAPPVTDALKVAGLPARRVAFPVRGPGGRTIALSYTFVIVDGRRFAVVAATDAERLGALRATFDKMTASLVFSGAKP